MDNPEQALRSKPPFVPFADQAVYLAHTAGGQQAVMQTLWLYRRPVNLEALAQFHDNLAHGRLARLIRPALLPFGRHQWTRAPLQPPAMAVAATPLAPEMLQEWADAQVELPMDPVRGPGWTFTVQPFTDGSTGVSLVISHCIADGMATALALREAVHGERRAMAYPAWSEKRTAAMFGAECLRALQDAPATLRAVAHLARRWRMPRGRQFKPTPPPVAAVTDDRIVAFPWASVRVPISVWDAKARSLGANRFTLLAALTAAFAEALGRVRGDDVTLLIPVNQREGESDSGGNCVSLATLKVPSTEPYGRLHAFQRRLQAELLRTRRETDPLTELLPLVPFIPKRAVSAAGNLALDALADFPVTCTFIGEWPVDVLRIDGAEADRLSCRGTDRQVRTSAIEARQGVASIPACVISEFLMLNFVAYQPGLVTEHHQLRAMVRRLLETFGIPGEFLDE